MATKSYQGRVTERLRGLIDSAGGQTAFARLVWGDPLPHKGKVQKWYKGVSGISAAEADTVADKLVPRRSVEWILTGNGSELARDTNTNPMATDSRGDPRDRAALEGILSSTPLQSHLTYEYRALVPVVFKIAESMARQRDGRDPLARLRLAGRLLGRCLGEPLRILGVGEIPPHDKRIAQAYITAAAHAVELAAAYARPPRGAPARRAGLKARKKQRGGSPRTK